MPSIAKQRRVNRSKVLLKRAQRLTVNPKLKPFNPLCGKLKSNNNLLAKALSIQKQENQLLDSQNIELTKQLQALRMACNKRDMACADINHNAKEVLALLVKATNHLTNIIVTSGEFVAASNRTTLLPSPVSNTRRDSSRRLSMKSPAKGVVKPMVSGHTITKPTITLQRLNMQGYDGHFVNLSIIDEGSPSSSNSSPNTSGSHTVSITSANRLGLEGERRRRLPERIPLEYVGGDDDEGVVNITETRRPVGKFSGRLSNSFARKRSGETLPSQIRSPRVSLFDVSKLLQNSQINLSQLENSRRSNGDTSGLSNTPANSSKNIEDEATPASYMTAREFQGVRRSLDATFQTSEVLQGVLVNGSTMNATERSNDSEIDPIEGPSWLLNESGDNRSFHDTKFEETVEIVRKKPPRRQIESSDSEPEEDNRIANESMEFTECVNPHLRRLEVPISRLSHGEIIAKSDVVNNFLQDRVKESIYSGETNLSISSSSVCTDFSINRSTEFVTDRRRGYSQDDDEDEPDTIMLQFSRGRKPKIPNMKFDINELRLPVIHTPIPVPAEPEDDQEVTRTIRILPGNCSMPSLVKDSVDCRESTLHLPRDDDHLKAKRQKRPVKTLQPKKNVKVSDDSSESDSAFENDKRAERDAEKKKSAVVKDPSSAKVVLKKLNNNDVKIRCGTPDLFEKSQDPDTSNQRSSLESRNLEPLTDSSIYSLTEPGRPRRQKAPRNLKEPGLAKKLRRDF